MTRNAATSAGGDAEWVVEQEPGPNLRTLPEAVPQRVENRDWLYEVRSQPANEQRPLAQSLANQPDVEHLEVAKAAVDQLARPARGAGRPVAHLEQRDIQSARHGVERKAGPHDPATDDDDVVGDRG